MEQTDCDLGGVPPSYNGESQGKALDFGTIFLDQTRIETVLVRQTKKWSVEAAFHCTLYMNRPKSFVFRQDHIFLKETRIGLQQNKHEDA